MAATVPSINSVKILEFLKSNFGREVEKTEIVNALGVSMNVVTGSLLALRNKHLIEERVEEYEAEPATETRKAKMKTRRFVTLKESALSYDPMKEYEKKKAEEEAAKAERKAAREAAKAAQ